MVMDSPTWQSGSSTLAPGRAAALALGARTVMAVTRMTSSVAHAIGDGADAARRSSSDAYVSYGMLDTNTHTHTHTVNDGP